MCKQGKILKTKGTIGKIVVAYAYFTGAFEKGSWTDDQNSAYWGFLVSVRPIMSVPFSDLTVTAYASVRV